jgi:hypothetical protein
MKPVRVADPNGAADVDRQKRTKSQTIRTAAISRNPTPLTRVLIEFSAIASNQIPLMSVSAPMRIGRDCTPAHET